MPEDDPLLTGRTKETVRVIELDVERTAKFIDGVISTSATIRGFLVTAWVALITLAFDTGNWTLAAASFAVVVAFGFVDGYHSWVYGEALEHAAGLEGFSQAYYRVLTRGDVDRNAQRDFEAKLQEDRPGIYTNLHKFKWKDFKWRDLGGLRPKVFFEILYPALLVVSIVATAVLAATATSNNCYSVEVQATPAASRVTGPPPSPLLSPGQQVQVCKEQGN
jgi:hypothetical protein